VPKRQGGWDQRDENEKHTGESPAHAFVKPYKGGGPRRASCRCQPDLELWTGLWTVSERSLEKPCFIELFRATLESAGSASNHKDLVENYLFR
jgi:hypothetical protein